MHHFRREIDFLLHWLGPDLPERGGAVLEFRVLAFRHERSSERRERRLRRPCVCERRLHRVDAGVAERLQHRRELIPCLRRVLWVEPDLAEQFLVVDVPRRIAGERQSVQLLLGRVGRLHEVLRDVHHALVEFVDDRIIGEIMEDAARREGAETVVAVEGDDIRDAVLDEARAQVGLRVRGIVDVDADVRIIPLEFLGRLLEPVRGLSLELEEIERDASVGAGRAAAGRPQSDGERAYRGADSFP